MTSDTKIKEGRALRRAPKTPSTGTPLLTLFARGQLAVTLDDEPCFQPPASGWWLTTPSAA
jgi:hypothetical protein